MFHLLQRKQKLKKLQQGDHKCASGGGGSARYGQRPYFDHFFFFGPFPNLNADKTNIMVISKDPATRKEIIIVTEK